MSDIEMLLSQIKQILEIQRSMPVQPGKNFNVFSLLGCERQEVNVHCRMLYELLNPSGSHGCGDIFLKSFFERVLQKPYPKSGATIRREASIGRTSGVSGRIDLLIEGSGLCYPIEVKVDAPDQPAQIARYNSFAKKQAKESQVFYLTMDGSKPSEDSTGGDSDLAQCISFYEDIHDWLLCCVELAWQIPMVVGTIRQYANLIETLNPFRKEDAFMEAICKTIGMSKNNYQAAAAIEEVMTSVRTKMICQVFSEIDDFLSARLEKVDSTYEEDSQFYYQPRKSSYYPEATYRIKKFGEVSICLTVELWDRLYYGVTITNADDEWLSEFDISWAEAFDNNAWKEQMKKRVSKTDDSCFVWSLYLPPMENPIDFTNCTGRYADLFDPEEHKRIMENIFAEFDANLDSIKKTGLSVELIEDSE